jgi:AraC-like DNA-binding protein
MPCRLGEYVRADGTVPFRKWFDALPADAAAKVAVATTRLAMALTRAFRKTVAARVRRDPKFAKALLDEAATLFLNGEPDAARLILRDLVNATVGFETLAAKTSKPSKSLHRMLSSRESVDEIAARVGYADGVTLRTLLRRHLGYGIREIRRTS